MNDEADYPKIPTVKGDPNHRGSPRYRKLSVPEWMDKAVENRVQILVDSGHRTDYSKEVRQAIAFLLEHPDAFGPGGLEALMQDPEAREDIDHLRAEINRLEGDLKNSAAAIAKEVVAQLRGEDDTKKKLAELEKQVAYLLGKTGSDAPDGTG